MLPRCRSFPLILAALFLALPVLGRQVEDSRRFTRGTITTSDGIDCPSEGNRGDPWMNQLKNRDLAPETSPPLFSITQIIRNVPQLAFDEGESDRDRWEEASRQQIAGWEDSFVRVQGWMLKSERMGEESCNCGSRTDRDYHLWVVRSKRETTLGRSVVMEISPRLLPAHSTWTTAGLKQLERDRARVRGTGWLFWDQEHHEQLAKEGRDPERVRRATLWEIHPVHRIEVYDFAAEEWNDL